MVDECDEETTPAPSGDCAAAEGESENGPPRMRTASELSLQQAEVRDKWRRARAMGEANSMTRERRAVKQGFELWISNAIRYFEEREGRENPGCVCFALEAAYSEPEDESDDTESTEGELIYEEPETIPGKRKRRPKVDKHLMRAARAAVNELDRADLQEMMEKDSDEVSINEEDGAVAEDAVWRELEELDANARGEFKLSSGEAEAAGASEVLKLARYCKFIAEELGIDCAERINLETDASVAIAFSNGGTSKMKHIDARLAWVQSLRDKEVVRLVKVPGAENPADFYTKVMPACEFRKQLERKKKVKKSAMRSTHGESVEDDESQSGATSMARRENGCHDW